MSNSNSSEILVRSSLFTVASIKIGNESFGIRTQDIQEVVNEEYQYSPIPFSPPHLLGYINLRNELIPVADIGALYDFAKVGQSDQRKIAIIKTQHLKVGLIISSTGEVLRLPQEQYTLSGNGSNHLIEGMLKTGVDDTVLQIINPDNICTLWNNHSTNSSEEELTKIRGKVTKCITMESAFFSYAVNISSIHSIADLRGIEQSPCQSKLCLGIITVNENVIPLIDFTYLLTKESEKYDSISNSKVVIFLTKSGFIGIVMKSIVGISSYCEEDVLRLPLVDQEMERFFSGALSHDTHPTRLILNTETLFEIHTLEEVASSHRKLFQQEALQKNEEQTTQNEAFLDFLIVKVGIHIALPLKTVKEILDQSKALTNAVDLPCFITGILNLRGVLVHIVDLRILYKIPGSTASTHYKIVITETTSGYIGFKVDDISSIETLNTSISAGDPNIFLRGASPSLRDDIVATSLISDEGSTLIYMLGMEKVLRRISTSTMHFNLIK